VSLACGAGLIIAASDGKARLAAIIYAVAVSGLLGTSALYHRVTWRPKARRWMRRLDHSMIFVLIAGTCTPVAVLSLEGVLPVVVLAILWGGALAGLVLNLVWISAPRHLVASVYVVLGWIAILPLPEVVRTVGVAPALLFVAGGALYTVGAVIYMRRRPDPRPAVFGFHEIFHIFVIAAAAAHFIAIAAFVVPSG
jgi:hemolysin III